MKIEIPLLIPIFGNDVRLLVDKINKMIESTDDEKKIYALKQERERLYKVSTPIDYVFKEDARPDQLARYK